MIEHDGGGGHRGDRARGSFAANSNARPHRAAAAPSRQGGCLRRQVRRWRGGEDPGALRWTTFSTRSIRLASPPSVTNGIGSTSGSVVYRDDLPAVSISRLRALDIITAEMTEFVVRLGHIEKTVSLHLRKWPSGGSWSWFGCPTCGKWARTLRLHLNNIVCPSCCTRRGIRPRASTLSRRQRASRRIPQLRAMLETETSLRLKSHHLRYSKLERRKRLEAALARCEFIVSRGSCVFSMCSNRQR